MSEKVYPKNRLPKNLQLIMDTEIVNKLAAGVRRVDICKEYDITHKTIRRVVLRHNQREQVKLAADSGASYSNDMKNGTVYRVNVMPNNIYIWKDFDVACITRKKGNKKLFSDAINKLSSGKFSQTAMAATFDMVV